MHTFPSTSAEQNSRVAAEMRPNLQSTGVHIAPLRRSTNQPIVATLRLLHITLFVAAYRLAGRALADATTIAAFSIIAHAACVWSDVRKCTLL